MNDKYKLTKESIEVNGEKLFRIEALKSFGSVSKGEKGGFIKAEANLSVYGNAWVSGDAWVYGKLKLKAGFFFGVKWKGEKIQEVEIENGNYLVYKGDAEFGEDEVTLVGQEAEVTIGGKKYKATITSESL